MWWQLLAGTSVDLGPALTQIGIGALIAVPAYYMAWKLWQRSTAADRQIAVLNELWRQDQKEAAESRMQDQKDAATRDRALADRMAPLLENAVTTLRLVRDSRA